jgi:membrane protease YdiL (CAAX protease family)
MTSLFDHLLVFGFAVLWPIVALFGYRKFVARVKAGVPGARFKEYLETIAVQWAWVAVVVAIWVYFHRPAAALGLTLGRPARGAIGLVLTVGILALLFRQWSQIKAFNAVRRARLAASLGETVLLLPTNAREHAAFRALAVTAGICEEILVRGYLIWYIGAFIGSWAALVVASVAFGLAHAYQGRKGILKTGIVGFVMGALYLGTGSLLWPMIVHAAIDLQGGALGRLVAAGPATPGEEKAMLSHSST